MMEPRLYLPYVVGTESPIPFLFEKTAPYFANKYIITIHSQDGKTFGSNRISEIKTHNESVLDKILKFGISSINQFDLIHTGAGGRLHYHSAQLGTMRNRNAKHIHTFRVDIDPERWNPEIRRRTAEMADVVTAVSEHTARTAEREFGISPKVIYNGVDLNEFAPDRGPSKVLEDLGINEPVFLFVGAFHTRKRPLDFVKVASRVPDASFVMAGDGPQFDTAKRRAESIDNLYLLGRVEKSKLPPIYAEASGFIFPSTQEGCPNVVLESLASGTPVLGYEATSMPELVETGRTGELVEPEDIDRLVGAVNRLLETDIESMGLKAREYAVENHRFKHIANQYLEVYEDVLTQE